MCGGCAGALVFESEPGGKMTNYGYDVKKQWRKEQWQAIAKRVACPRSARVIYLAGPDNFDVWEAKKVGFIGSKMIAVERDEETARDLRRGTDQVVVTGGFWDVVAAYALRERIDVVVGDFVSGITDEILFCGAATLLQPHLQGSVVAINLQRGRESRHHAHAHSLIEQRMAQDWDPHRGKLTLFGWANVHAHFLAKQNGWSEQEKSYFVGRQFSKWWDGCCRGTYPAESGKLKFDSLIFQNVAIAAVGEPLSREDREACSAYRLDLAPTTRAIAAAKATRTQKFASRRAKPDPGHFQT
jgi:hypothetical protein